MNFANAERRRMHRRLGQNLRRIRNERGLTQEQLEELSGFNQATISLWETGRGGWPRDSVLQLAKVLNIDMEELFLRPETREQIGGANLIAGLSADDAETVRCFVFSLQQRRQQRGGPTG